MESISDDVHETEETRSPRPTTVDGDVIVDSTVVAPVLIEELDESAVCAMNVDMTEFVETTALRVREVRDASPVSRADIVVGRDVLPDAEDQDASSLTADEEDRLTKQFLNGELTFSEYSSRMDRDVDVETTDIDDPSRRNVPTAVERGGTRRIVERKPAPRSGNAPRQKRRRRVLPPVLQGLMGEANLRYAKGEVDLAARICMEIIRQVPSAPEPFQTLAMIYETDQPDKSLQFALIAAHLSPKDAEQWIRLANLSLESGDVRQAITCYSKAIQASPKDVALYEARARLQERNGDRKAYLRGYAKLIHQLESEDGECIVRYAKLLAKCHIEESNNEQALEAMEIIFAKCPRLVTLEEVNVMTELLITLKRFERCLDVLTEYTGIRVRYRVDVSDRRDEITATTATTATTDTPVVEIESCDVPDSVVVDLRAKLLVTLVELNHLTIADRLLPAFYTREDPETSGDLFLDVAEALMGKKEFRRALLLLDPLVESKNFSLAAVWLRHAECWVGCNDLAKAVWSYEAVRRLSPRHLGARLALATLYENEGLYDRAIDVLHQDPETDALDPDVVYRRTLLLFKVQRYDEYLVSGMLLLSRHCANIRRKVELNALARATGVRQRLESLQLRRLSCGEKLDDEDAPTFADNPKPCERDEFLLFLRMCRLACRLKKYGLLQRICFTALTSKRFRERNSHVIFLCLISCIHNKDSFYGYNIVREFVRVCQRSNTWNLLNIIIQRAEDLRHNRFIMRLLGREDVFSYLHIMHANNCLVSGTYKYALNGYISLFKVAPSALLALLIGVTQLQMACQKMSAKKNQLVIQALAFFKKYMQLRGADGRQETYYNMARAFHQIGLLPSAIRFYKMVLEEDPGDLVRRHANLLDLRKEAAFNLHLIYLQSENHLLARMYLESYITVIMATSLDDMIEFKRLCDILENVAKAHRVRDKTRILQTFLDDCLRMADKLRTERPESDASLYPILRLMLPRLERQRGSHNLRQTSLARLYARVHGFANKSDDYKNLTNYREPVCGKFVGNDFAERAYWILNKRLPRGKSGLTIARVNAFLDDISGREATMSRKEEAFRVLFRRITGLEMKWMTRIILKDLRLGIETRRILHAYHRDANQQFLVTNDLREIFQRLHESDDSKATSTGDIKVFSHFKPMLLERCNIENTERLFRDNDSYYVQSKFDGERSQLHMKDGKYKYFTRRGYDITENPGYGRTGSSGFLTGVLTRRLNPNCQSFILDGELMGWHKDNKNFGTKGMNFDVKRLSTNSRYQPCFVAFDVILHNDILLVDRPYSDRLKLLDDMFTEEEGSLIRCRSALISSREELIEAFNRCIRDNEEGLVLKKRDVRYKPNVRNGSDCYKIKAEYSENLVQDVDLIVLGGYYGTGKYTGTIKSFMMGVAVPTSAQGENPSRFLSVVSVSTGIGDGTLRELQIKFAPHWSKERPESVTGPKGSQPDVWIDPKHSLILTIRATEMIRSNEYPTGYSLRFPRVVHVRMDKPWYGSCTTSELLSLVKDRGMIQKLTKREATLSDEALVPKSRKTANNRPRFAATIERNDATYNERVMPITRLLDGKEICVINGAVEDDNEDLSKEHIERTLRQHSAKIVQNPMNSTFCVIVGNDKTMRGKQVVNSGKYDVVRLDWFKRVTDRFDLEASLDFLPWELLCTRDATRDRFAQIYDEYYDNLIIDADRESLQRSLDRIANLRTDKQTTFTVQRAKEMDEELFDKSPSPYSPFRDIVGFFENRSYHTCQKCVFQFRFMSGTFKDDIDDSVTHIFVEDAETLATVRKRLRALESKRTCVKIVECRWIEECFRNGVCDITDYLID